MRGDKTAVSSSSSFQRIFRMPRNKSYRQLDKQNLNTKATLQKKQPKWDTPGLIQFPDLSVKGGFELPSGQKPPPPKSYILLIGKKVAFHLPSQEKEKNIMALTTVSKKFPTWTLYKEQGATLWLISYTHLPTNKSALNTWLFSTKNKKKR